MQPAHRPPGFGDVSEMQRRSLATANGQQTGFGGTTLRDDDHTHTRLTQSNTEFLANRGCASSSGSAINPTSTFQFLLHMAYPPPPIEQERLRRVIENLTAGPARQLDIHTAMYVVEEIDASPFRIVPAVLFVIQQRLHSSKFYRVSLALQLLRFISDRCGLAVLRIVNKDMMKSIGAIIRTSSFKERTFTGQLNKLGKYITGNGGNTSISTSVEVHNVRNEAKGLIKHWVDTYGSSGPAITVITQYYKSLLEKNIKFDNLPSLPGDAAQQVSSEFINSRDFCRKRDSDASETQSAAADEGLTAEERMRLEALLSLLKNARTVAAKDQALQLLEKLRALIVRKQDMLSSRLSETPSVSLNSGLVHDLSLLADLLKYQQPTQAVPPLPPAPSSSMNLLDELI